MSGPIVLRLRDSAAHCPLCYDNTVIYSMEIFLVSKRHCFYVAITSMVFVSIAMIDDTVGTARLTDPRLMSR